MTEPGDTGKHRGEDVTPEGGGAGLNLGRMLRIALLVFALALGGIGVAAWVSGDPETLPFEYEGFD